MVIFWEQSAMICTVVQLMLLPTHHLLLYLNPEWFAFLVLAYPGCPRKATIKRVYVFSAYEPTTE